MDEENTATEGYDTPKAQLTFTWICPDCNEVNHQSWDEWKFYKAIAECSNCENPVKIIEPW